MNNKTATRAQMSAPAAAKVTWIRRWSTRRWAAPRTSSMLRRRGLAWGIPLP